MRAPAELYGLVWAASASWEWRWEGARQRMPAKGQQGLMWRVGVQDFELAAGWVRVTGHWRRDEVVSPTHRRLPALPEPRFHRAGFSGVCISHVSWMLRSNRQLKDKTEPSSIIYAFYWGRKGICTHETISRQYKTICNFSKQYKIACNLVQNCLAGSVRALIIQRRKGSGWGILRDGFCETWSQVLRNRIFQCWGNTLLSGFCFCF